MLYQALQAMTLIKFILGHGHFIILTYGSLRPMLEGLVRVYLFHVLCVFSLSLVYFAKGLAKSKCGGI